MHGLVSIEDFWNWEKLIATLDAIGGLTDPEREKARRALTFLRAELGEGFLTNAKENRHPLLQYIWNPVPWTRQWLCEFADALRLARSDQKYPQLLSKVADANRFSEAFQVLNVGTAFRRQGFTVETDPPLTAIGSAKIPDLLLTDPVFGDRIYVEVTALTESDMALNAYRTMNRIHAPIMRAVPFLLFSARIQKALAPRHLEDVGARIDDLVNRVKSDNSFAQLVIEGVLEIGVSPESDKALLEQWAAARSLAVGTVEGPPVRTDELLRVRAKIRKEQEQLPHDLPGIVVAFTNRLFPFVRDPRMLINELEEAVYNHDHLLGAVIIGSQMGGVTPDELLMAGQHVYIRRTSCGLLVEEHVVLLNKFCKHKVSAGAITKFYNAFKPVQN